MVDVPSLVLARRPATLSLTVYAEEEEEDLLAYLQQ